MSVIDVSALSKQFKGKKRTTVDALKNLDLQVKSGEVFGFLGPNGAGKSTTIKLVMGLLRPTSGSARIMGVDSNLPDSRLRVGFLPENPAFFDYLSAEEYIAFVGTQFRMETEVLKRRSDEVLKRLDLWDARKRPIRGYSKGMVQRVGLAQTLVHDPDLYILDEPMSGLDPIGRALVKEIILDLKEQGKTVFFSTHITDDVEKVCDRVAVLVKGSLVALDSVGNILKSGIEGYQVQLRASAEDERFAPYLLVRECGMLLDYYVPKKQFSTFMHLVADSTAEVEVVETKRKNLEDFFLSLVEQNS